MENHLTLVHATRQKDALTINGAKTNSTSLSNCLDFFFLSGASRGKVLNAEARISEVEDLITIFLRAKAEDPILAHKILFWARDCRAGAGEKKFFQVFAKYLKENYPKDWEKLYPLIPVYGYWKDFFIIQDANVRTLTFLAEKLLSSKEEDHSNLLAKWYPRKGEWFTAMHKILGITPKVFRKLLVDKTNVVETRMCNKEWESIEYSKIPSVAMNRYRNAFMRRDEKRFTQFNEAVLKGDTTVNASVLHPHELYNSINRGEDYTAVEAQWKSLPNYMEGSEDRVIPVCDVSGSMTGLPMSVSVSLGLYISERNEGIFKDAFITFSENPTMEYIKGKSLKERMIQLESSSWGMNTDLEAVFMLILTSAVDNDLPESQMPTKILIISDMEFDSCTKMDNTLYESITELYEAKGYKLPGIVFWNVNGRAHNVPVNKNQKGVGLVSGFSPAILTSILGNEPIPTPYDLMLKTLNNERYDLVTKCLNS